MAQSNSQNNNFYHPKGYALVTAIDDYSKTVYNNLKECINDSNFWENQFKNTWSYDHVYTLRNAEVTAEKVYTALWCMASIAQPGDIVAFTFSGHGVVKTETKKENGKNISKDRNRLMDYKGVFIRDTIINLLLKAFKPKVRIVLILDACQSGSFVELREDLYADPKDSAVEEFTKAIIKTFPYDETKIRDLINKQSQIKLTAAVAQFGSVIDSQFVPDGAIRKWTESFFWGLGWYTLPEWRNDLEEKYDAQFYKDEMEFHKFLDYGENNNLTVKKFLKQWKTDFNLPQNNYQFLMGLYKTSNIYTEIFLKQLIALKAVFIDEEAQEQWDKRMEVLLEIKQRADYGNPSIVWAGYRSEAFKNQYMLKKFDRAFYNENGV